MITTRDSVLAEKCRVLLNQGQVQRYVHTMEGWNYRMTNIAAAIGLVQLESLAEWTRARRSNAQFLQSHLPRAILLSTAPEVHHVYHQFTVRVPDGRRADLRAHLEQAGIQSDVYYPTPLHHQPAFAQDVTLPGAEDLAQSVLSLPVHPSLSPEDLNKISFTVSEFLK